MYGIGGKIIAIVEANEGLVDKSRDGMDILAMKAYHKKKRTIIRLFGTKMVRFPSKLSK